MTAPPRRELLPCPFCGGNELVLHECDDNPGGESWVSCFTCGADSGMKNTEEAAIEAWNTRAPSPELAAARKEERERCAVTGRMAVNECREEGETDLRCVREHVDAAIRALED